MRKKSTLNSSKPSQHLNTLAEQVGEFIEYWGFKRVHGRLWTHLFLSPEPLDAAQFIERLGISKALVSMTLSDLLEFQVILPAGKSERGTELYLANPETTQVILNVLRNREQKMLERIDQAFSNFKHAASRPGSDLSVSSQNLQSMEELIESGKHAMQGLINLTSLDLKEWR